MSPSNVPERPKAHLVVNAAEPIEIFLIDHTFHRVAEGIGSLDWNGEAGLYKLKLRAGSRIQEISVELKEGEDKFIEAPKLDFSSAAPIAGTRRTHEYHMDAAENVSRIVHCRLGTGSQLFVFVRMWTDTTRPEIPVPPPKYNPANGLSLHDAHGKLLIDFKQSADSNLDRDAWAGLNIELKPGFYRLRVKSSTVGTLEQGIFVSMGWQTQVFLLLTNYGNESNPDFHADLARGTVLMSREGFNYQREDFRLVELARIGLANQRALISRRDMDYLLYGKFDDPMLGIYGGHALLLGENTDSNLIREITRNLYHMLGPHPDVLALALTLEKPFREIPDMSYEFTLPPMLNQSWQIIVNATNNKRAQIPSTSFAAQIALNLWGDSIWLVWKGDALESEAGVSISIPLQETLSQIASKTFEFPADEESFARLSAGLNATESAILWRVMRPHIMRELEKRAGVEVKRDKAPTRKPDVTSMFGKVAGVEVRRDETIAKEWPSPYKELPQTMAQSLGIPISSLEIATDSLLKKLKLVKL